MSVAPGEESRDSDHDHQPTKSNWFSSVSTGLASESSFSSPTLAIYDQKTSPPGPQKTNKLPSLNSIMMNTENSQSTETIRAGKEQQEEEEEHYHPIIKIIEKQELGRHILVLAIPMIIGLKATSNPDSMNSVCVLLVLVGLLFGFSAIWNGILLRKTYPKASIVILVVGIGLMLFVFYTFMGCFLPPSLQWIPGVCWLSYFFPLAMVFFGKNKIDDPEKGKKPNMKHDYICISTL
ncbi:putative Ileal sodium/bile acid cotransporter [Quillaja saponaria]|uniref:Ileal sodium/bile acid cotransporter n=1 Tax=Quillaja saponaria TaxID=32244 RepID=A0AAD7KNU1_QUISA|nr:putative Ileal sodium/bile acid cotransporter [Quillaja saponaria]